VEILPHLDQAKKWIGGTVVLTHLDDPTLVLCIINDIVEHGHSHKDPLPICTAGEAMILPTTAQRRLKKKVELEKIFPLHIAYNQSALHRKLFDDVIFILTAQSKSWTKGLPSLSVD
jgi:hypothetical protein